MKTVDVRYSCDVCGKPAPYVLRLQERHSSGAGAPSTLEQHDLCADCLPVLKGSKT